MDSDCIERLLKKQPRFQGVFSAGTLPTTPRLLVCNTDPAHMPGQHWIAIYVDKGGRGEFFDSFGRAPDEHFECYMNANCARWTFNKKQLQSKISAFCGYYCCLYVALKCQGLDMTKILAMFTRDTGYNDWLVHRIVCNKS